jgi:hypothetical protein
VRVDGHGEVVVAVEDRVERHVVVVSAGDEEDREGVRPAGRRHERRFGKERLRGRGRGREREQRAGGGTAAPEEAIHDR